MKKIKKRTAREQTKKSKAKSQKAVLRESILAILQEFPGKPATIKQITKKLGLKKRDDIKQATLAIYQLEDDAIISSNDKGGFFIAGNKDALTGIVDHVSSRFAYVKIGEDRPDVYIKARDLGSAVDGDTVKINVHPTRHGDHPEGEVVEIVRRSRTRYVGKIEVSKKYAFVVPDYRKMHQDFYVYPENIFGAQTGDKVIVEVTDWGGQDKKPEAKVIEVLGRAGENEAEIHSIMAEFGLPFRFDVRVENEANTIDEGITREEIAKRRDFRGITTFTIDPFDAKDFDDALSFRVLENGNYEIGIHIADVTHYVQQKS